MHDGKFGWAAAAALALWAGGALSAQAQETTPTGASPPLEVLVKCADMGDKDSRLACYDAAMRAAGYAPKPEAVAAAKHKSFGLSNPFGSKDHEDKEQKRAEKQAQKQAKASERGAEESPNEITVQVSQVAVVEPEGRLIIFTEDGQIWEQTDQVQLAKKPELGSSFRIHKSVLGGYFCDVDPYKSVKCKRDR
jgi:hypothetical protein